MSRAAREAKARDEHQAAVIALLGGILITALQQADNTLSTLGRIASQLADGAVTDDPHELAAGVTVAREWIVRQREVLATLGNPKRSA